MEQDWSKLYFGKVAPAEVAEAVKDSEWQKVRVEMKGRPLCDKYDILSAYYDREYRVLQANAKYGGMSLETYVHDLRMLQVRCTNYVTALSRGGLIDPEDYR